MSSEKFIKIGLGISVGVLSFAFLFLAFITNSNDSYAIPTGIDYSGKPTSTFTSNVTSSSITNYIQQANGGGGGAAGSSAIDNFNVPSTFKTSDNSKPLYKLMKNLETPTTSEEFELIDENPSSITDKGILYILGHGYNVTNTSHDIFSTGTYGAVTDGNIKEYITQIALWVYIYEHKSTFSETYCANGGCDFKVGDTLVSTTEVRNIITTAGNKSGYNYLKYITLLVDNANNYTGGGTSQISAINGNSLSYTINNDYTLLTTEAITPAASSNIVNYMYYSVEVNDPEGYGVYITNAAGARIGDLSIMSGSFKVAVPLASDLTTMDLTKVQIKVFGHFIYDDGYEYRVTNSPDGLLNTDKTQKFSNVLLGYVPYEIQGVNFNLHNFTKISKVDITDSTELPGATLELTNKATNEKQTWVSTTVPHYVSLSAGNYKLCETIQPEGFELQTECIDFTVTANEIQTVTMTNTPVGIPDTSRYASSFIKFIGFVFVVLGCAVTTIILLTKKSSEV